jgi:hypothetical protein
LGPSVSAAPSHVEHDAVATISEAQGGALPVPYSLPERPALGEPVAGLLFGAQSWQPPARKVTAARVAPSAPPLPYRFVGRLVHDGKLQFFLSRDEGVIPITEGDMLDGTYRIESISGDRITLVYLPLNYKHDIPIAVSPRTGGATVSATNAVTHAPQSGIGTISTESVVASARSR